MGRQCSGMDNFSRLPDELVLRIISLLPMKDAVLLLLPPSLFTCETLVVLKLSVYSEFGQDVSDELSLKVPANVCLPSLKVLHLVDSTFSDDCCKRLFSNCPVLEDLKCSFKESNWKFIVCNPTLKRLTITSTEYHDGRSEIVVNTPGLDYLELSVWDVYSCTFLNVQALAKANIHFLYNEWEDYDKTYINALANLMKAISNIQTLRISGSTLYEFSCIDIPIPRFNNVTHLTIASCKECGFPELQYILACCESLETLVLEDGLGCQWDSGEGTISWSSSQEEDEFIRLSFCMKKIVFLWFEGSEVEIELAKYFLQSAEVLESMEIHIKAGYQDQLEITKEELQRLPRASNECIVDIV
ncbi:hypothetical protein SLEP1_g42797 [Rubroshorea leprosula]|uniref:FBD domain-containing protein n=1 Tax=Rubroshorea leprosula TaxID=152421 RepID=A0AAV5LB04_9ROSI|nr:hypothetical protein SLEP1_g42797 [Rubroshorea leprosula]